jgi:two-component system phosphate regulon sensor histidine kinase PhoR
MIVLVILVIYGQLSFVLALVGMCVVFLGSLLFAYPYQKDLSALTRYVEKLALDRRSEAPPLSFLSNVDELSNAVSMLHDTWTNRKNALESAVAESRILLDTLPDTLIMLDNDLRIIRTNNAALKTLGKRIIGQSLRKAIRHRGLIEEIEQVLLTNEGTDIDISFTPRLVEHSFRCKIQRFPVQTEGGIAIVMMMIDITEAKQTKRMLKDFVANASHEIRTPLTSIIGSIETLQDGAKDEPKILDRFLGLMQEQAAHMNYLVQDLLSLSKAEMNESIPLTEKVSVSSLIKSALHKVEWMAQEKSMTLTLQLQEKLPHIIGDSHELGQVFLNLLTNATKYGFENSAINVTVNLIEDGKEELGEHHARIVVSVTDEGEGIEEKHIPRLTERFYRVDKARSRKVGGTGLGLCIVKHILNRHQGELSIKSTVGKGSTFSVFLPVPSDE